MKKQTRSKVADLRDPWSVLRWAHLAEKSMAVVEKENKLVLIVDKQANKAEIGHAVEIAFGVKVASINTQICSKGKKAYIRLKPGYSAADIATKLGMV